MKKYVEISEQESVLIKWRGAQAKLWMFHVTHNRMAICLFRKGEHEALYVVAVACERLSGAFHWDQANIKIIAEPPNQWGEIRRRILDSEARFELFCSDVVIFEGPATVPIDPFDNFLNEK